MGHVTLPRGCPVRLQPAWTRCAAPPLRPCWRDDGPTFSAIHDCPQPPLDAAAAKSCAVNGSSARAYAR
eukprot:3719115-Prymnesium_polylepis.1